MRTMLVDMPGAGSDTSPRRLARWWQGRFADSGGRTRKIAIVALARKLLVALWRYLERGVVPEGAVLKPRVVGAERDIAPAWHRARPRQGQTLQAAHRL